MIASDKYRDKRIIVNSDEDGLELTIENFRQHDLIAIDPKGKLPDDLDKAIIVKTQKVFGCESQVRLLHGHFLELKDKAIVFEDQFEQWHNIYDIICWYEI